MTEGYISTPPSKKALALMLGGAFAAASILTVFFILPAESGIDLTGFGKLTGLSSLATPAPITEVAPAAGARLDHSYANAWRSDTIEISLPPESFDSELEYKVAMKKDATLVYSWAVTGEDDPELFYYDLHSENWPRKEGEAQRIAEFAQTTGLKANGAIVAPFDGVHGWYFQNQSEKLVVVHLRIAGFYDLIPPGAYGNLSKIEPKK